MQKYLYTFSLFFIAIVPIFSQNITATMRGTVQDALTKQPLIGATIQVFNISFSKGSTADEAGNFIINDIPVGRYEVQISYLGYETLLLSETLLEAGKERVLEINLQESTSELQQVVVKSTSQNTNISPLSNHEITIEEVQRFPATFFDPARLAMLYPGVTGTNDQANGLSIRGLPPSLLQWRLEGVEIVNPNHLSNAGTVSDQPSVSAGGVNILSAQMLDNSRLFTGAFPVEYSNVLGGVMDMRLRKGNNQQHEFTAQAGLLGFDLGMEGPFSQKSKASFLFNYRYSFTGLLTSFGVDFGGESIGFQDVSFNLNFPTKKAGEFMLFGIGGKSTNFKKALPLAEREVEKDEKQIDFSSKIGIAGMKHQFNFRNVFVETVLVYSGLEDNRIEEQVNTREELDLSKEKISVNHKVQLVFSKKKKLVLGFQLMKDNIGNVLRRTSSSTKEEGENDSVINLYFNHTNVWWNRLTVNFGVVGNWRKSIPLMSQGFEKTTFFDLDPRLSLQLPINNRASFNYSIGKYGMSFPLRTQNSFSVSQSLNYELYYEKKYRIKAEFFFQKMYDIPIIESLPTSAGLTFTAPLTVEEIVPFQKIRNFSGESKMLGLELLFQKYFTEKSYSLFSATMYQSKYAAYGENNLDSKYSGDFILNAVWGREFQKKKKEKIRTLGFNIRGVVTGGFQEREIMIVNNRPRFSSEYTEMLPTFLRIDFRIYLRINKPKRTSTLSLDIQNATNHQNIAYHYFDTFSNEIKTQYQLGLIPLLNYRIEF